MDTSDYEWLVSDAARPWLLRAAEARDISARSIQALRKDLSAQRVRLVFEQVQLRRRGRDKFAQAEQMFFTRRTLEQATDEVLAAVKAQRFVPGAEVVDLCCGIGGDLLAIARRGPAVGVDRDPIQAILARANLRVAGCDGGAEVRCADAREVALSSFSGWHVDPDRRAQARRATRAESFEPDSFALEQWSRSAHSGGIKVAPATRWPSLPDLTLEREWLGSRGECRQQMIWCRAAACHPGLRTVTVCERNWPVVTLVECPDAVAVDANELGRFVFEAHAAVLAAGLTASLARQRNVREFPGVRGYLTGDSPQADALLDCYEVVERLPLDRRRIQQWLDARGIGRVIIKKRGVDVDPMQLERQWAGHGDASITLLITRWGNATIAIAARRWRPSPLPVSQPLSQPLGERNV